MVHSLAYAVNYLSSRYFHLHQMTSWVLTLYAGLAVDMKFDAAPPKSGPVSLYVQGATLPGNIGNFTQVPPPNRPQRRSRFEKRGFFDFIGDTINAIKNIDSFSKNSSTTLPPIDVNKDFQLLNADIDCSGSVAGASAGITANIKSDLLAVAHAEVTIGAAANGTIIPPLINEFVLFASACNWLQTSNSYNESDCL